MKPGCTVPECERTSYARGWCLPHYSHWRSTGTVQGLIQKVNATQGECDQENCTATPHARGMCQPHYIWWWRHEKKPSDVEQKLIPDGTEHVHVDGYIRVMKREHPHGHRGYVLQHRLIMEESLGRYLRPEETVHHINGNRADNRLANLELWASSHPSGQRVGQLVEWARSIEARYGPDVDIGRA